MADNEEWKKILWVNKDKQTVLLEQYRTYVESAYHVSNWRIATNTLHLTLAALLLGGFAFLLSQDPIPKPLVVTAWLAGLVLAFQWWSVILQYKRLNGAKFAVIHEMERELAVRPFDAEWQLVERGENSKLYWPVTHIERYMPLALALAETAVAIFVLVQ